jgi:hypothetical protein
MIVMRTKTTGMVLGVAVLLVAVGCRDGGEIPGTGPALDSGSCAGCLAWKQGLFSYVVRTDADYDSLAAECFHDRIREHQRPPRPGRGEVLVYVAIEGSGCTGCLEVVDVRRALGKTVVEVEGGFQGACEMLIARGAWALVPKKDGPITFEYRDVGCPEEYKVE